MLNFTMQIAREAGGLLMQRLGAAKITNKGDIDLVTEADLASEILIIERIRSYYPQHGILAEESGEAVLVAGKRSDWKWIIDPLDGTTNYAHGYPCFCVSIAVEHAGVLEIPIRIVQSVGDAIVLSVAVDELKQVLPGMSEPAAVH